MTDYDAYDNPNSGGQTGWDQSVFDITRIVQTWYTDPSTRHGLMIKEINEGTVQAQGGAYIKYYTKYNY